MLYDVSKRQLLKRRYMEHRHLENDDVSALCDMYLTTTFMSCD